MEELINRVRTLIDTCWESFSAKVGGGLITINKEASMQLQFAYILKNAMVLAIHHNDESIEIDLETGVQINGRIRECDIIINIKKSDTINYLPIEMKCYKKYAASGGKRGAIDIFMKDIYEDLALLELYAQKKSFIQGIQYTMTDYRNLAFPKLRKGKNWNYDTSHGYSILNGIHLTTPIGGKTVDVKLDGRYEFIWNECNGFYFIKLENKK
ncbi:MAG: hypothetical protein ACOCUV_00080 [bacterium]